MLASRTTVCPENIEAGGQHFPGDELLVALRPFEFVSRYVESDLDAVGHIETAGLAGILEATNDISGPAFGLEFLSEVHIQDDQPTDAFDLCGGFGVCRD